MRRTKDGANYIAPTQQMILKKAKKYGVKNFSPDFVEDLVNIQTGGRLLSKEEYMNSIPRLKKMENESIRDFESRSKRMRNNMESIYNGVKRVLNSIDLNSFKGNTPLEKTFDFISKLSSSDRGSVNEFEDGDMLPIFGDSDKTDNMIESLENMESLEGEGGEIIGKYNLDSNVISEFAKIKSQVDKLTKFKAAKIGKAVPDRNGNAMRLRVMNSPSELVNATPDAFALPKSLLAYKIATRQLLVKEKITYQERKQFLYCIIDKSGSMEYTDRCGQALAILTNRIQAVIKGEATLVTGWFDDKLRDVTFIRDVADANEFITALKECKSSKFSGGTNIDGCIKQAIDHIDELMKLNEFKNSDRPELCVITDGDDSVDLTPSDMKGIKLHSFIVGGENNTDLLKLSQATGGVAIRL